MTSTNIKKNPVQFIDITAAQAGQRIDNFLVTLEKGVPKSRIYKAIRKGEVRVNKGRIKQTYKIQAGDSIRVPPLHTTEKSTITTVNDHVRKQLTECILFEDDDLLALNKPPGLAVHAGSNIDQGIIESLRIIRSEQPYLELVHRLDRDTSGCLLLAKNRDALLNLQKQMVNHDINKRYLTLLQSGWHSGERLIEQPLQKNTVSSGERMVKIDPEGKYAKTVFVPLEKFPQAQLTEVILYTGRTHQIRVHSSHIGHPIAGDDKYGQRNFNKEMKKMGLKRMFLHSWKLGITHPSTGEDLLLEASLPLQLNNVLTKLRDSTGHIVTCMQNAITELGLPALDDSAVSHIIGLGLIEAVHALYPTIDRDKAEELAATYKRIWLTNPHHTPLFDNAIRLITALNEQDYFLGVATGKSRNGLNKVLKSSELGPLFHATRCADECHSKPHPQMIEELMDFVGVLPKETLMIGDTEYDLNMAHNAGADSIAITHGAHNMETLAACKPRYIAKNLFEVEDWLNNL